MSSAGRSLGLLSGVVFTSGFIYALKRNVHKDIHSHQERLIDVDYQLQTAFLPESKQAEQKDSRPLFREVHPRPYILDVYYDSRAHVQEELIPQIKSDWNSSLSSVAYYIGSLDFDFKNWSFKW